MYKHSAGFIQKPRNERHPMHKSKSIRTVGFKVTPRFQNDTRAGDVIRGAATIEIIGTLTLPHGNVKLNVTAAGKVKFDGFDQGVPTYTYTVNGESYTVTRPVMGKPYRGLPARHYADFCKAVATVTR